MCKRGPLAMLVVALYWLLLFALLVWLPSRAHAASSLYHAPSSTHGHRLRSPRATSSVRSSVRVHTPRAYRAPKGRSRR